MTGRHADGKEWCVICLAEMTCMNSQKVSSFLMRHLSRVGSLPLPVLQLQPTRMIMVMAVAVMVIIIICLGTMALPLLPRMTRQWSLSSRHHRHCHCRHRGLSSRMIVMVTSAGVFELVMPGAASFWDMVRHMWERTWSEKSVKSLVRASCDNSSGPIGVKSKS